MPFHKMMGTTIWAMKVMLSYYHSNRFGFMMNVFSWPSFLDCFDEHLDNVIAGSANAITQPAVHNNMTNEGDCLFIYLTYW